MKKSNRLLLILALMGCSVSAGNEVKSSDFEVAQQIAEVKELLNAFKKGPHSLKNVLKAAGKEAIISASIGAGIGLIVPLISFLAREEKLTAGGCVSSAAAKVLFNSLHGIVQGFLVGMAGCDGSLRPPLTTTQLVAIHVAHYALIDLIAAAGIPGNSFLLPIALAYGEILLAGHIRNGMHQEKAELEALLHILHAQERAQQSKGEKNEKN